MVDAIIELKARALHSRIQNLILHRLPQYGNEGRPMHLYIGHENWDVLKASADRSHYHGICPDLPTYAGLLVHLVVDEPEHLNVI